MGILFLGPPGTGKTLVAEALAKESQRNFVKLGDIREKWVGQSERNLTQVLEVIDAMRPIIVFVDEIDQAKGQRSEGGDSGVSGRIFAKLLTFMSDPERRGQVLIIAASNRPDKIDLAMKRAGRFDLKLPFFLPEKEDRVDIFKVILKSNQIPYDSKNIDFNQLADKTNGYSGAEIEMICNEALFAALERKDTTVCLTQQDFETALSNYQLSETDKQNRWAAENEILKDVPFKEFWPKRYQVKERQA
jgi:SpoVK/Ycf46/Vps4 family AAA+-type ATPase